jgi:peptidoglycan L-alanyl-D-glutamate endopeptidase CwlK
MHAANERVDHPHPGVSLFEVKRELSERSKKKIAELIPEFRTQVEQLMLQGLAAGLRPEIVEARRSQDRQNELYEQGRTKPGAIVTWTKDSAHTRGEAVDIAQLDENGNITYKTTGDFYPKMGAIGKSLGMIWGGDWKGKTDLPHFQYAKKS